MESIKGHPEHVETVFGEAIVARDESLVVLAGASGLGPPDLCWLQKAPKNALTGSSGEAKGYYHSCLGVDASSSAAVAAYFATLTSLVESPTFFQGLFSTSEVRIERGFYCCYDPLSRLDVRCELCIPGGVVCGALDCEGNVHDVTPELWRNCVVASFLRAELYDAELVSHSPVPVARYPPLPNPADELRLLEAVAGLYEDLVLPEALEALTVDQSGGASPEHGDVVLHTLLHYFSKRQRWGVALEFFAKLATTYPTAALYAAAVQRECGLYDEALSTLSRAVEDSPDEPVLLAGLAAECLYADQVDAALRFAAKAARLRPQLRPAWLILARTHVRQGAGAAALVVLNLVPPPPLPGKEGAMLHVVVPPEPKSMTKPAVQPYDLDVIAARQVLTEEAYINFASATAQGAVDSASLPGALLVPWEPPDAGSSPDTAPLRITRAVRAAVYTVLQDLVAVSGWDGFLRLRSSVFVMHADSDVLREQQREAEERERQLQLLHRQLSATLPPSPSWATPKQPTFNDAPQPQPQPPPPPAEPPGSSGKALQNGVDFLSALDEAAMMGLAEHPEHLEEVYDDPRVVAAREAHRRHLREIAERQARLEAAEGGAYADDEWDSSSGESTGGGGAGGGTGGAAGGHRSSAGRSRRGRHKGRRNSPAGKQHHAYQGSSTSSLRYPEQQAELMEKAQGQPEPIAAAALSFDHGIVDAGEVVRQEAADAMLEQSRAVGKGQPQQPAVTSSAPQQPATSSWWGALFGAGGGGSSAPQWREAGPLGEALEPPSTHTLGALVTVELKEGGVAAMTVTTGRRCCGLGGSPCAGGHNSGAAPVAVATAGSGRMRCVGSGNPRGAIRSEEGLVPKTADGSSTWWEPMVAVPTGRPEEALVVCTHLPPLVTGTCRGGASSVVTWQGVPGYGPSRESLQHAATAATGVAAVTAATDGSGRRAKLSALALGLLRRLACRVMVRPAAVTAASSCGGIVGCKSSCHTLELRRRRRRKLRHLQRPRQFAIQLPYGPHSPLLTATSSWSPSHWEVRDSKAAGRPAATFTAGPVAESGGGVNAPVPSTLNADPATAGSIAVQESFKPLPFEISRVADTSAAASGGLLVESWAAAAATAAAAEGGGGGGSVGGGDGGAYDGYPLILHNHDGDRQMVLQGLDVTELGAKRLCVRWFDELIVALWHDLQAFLDWKALDIELAEAGFRSHAEIVAGLAPAPTVGDYQQVRNAAEAAPGRGADLPSSSRSPPQLPPLPCTDWLRRGLLAERLHHEADALEAYQAAVMTPPPAHIAAGGGGGGGGAVFAALPGGGPGAFSMIAWQGIMRLAPVAEPHDVTWALRATQAVMAWLETRGKAGMLTSTATAVPFTTGFVAALAAAHGVGGDGGGSAAGAALRAAPAVATVASTAGGKLQGCPLTVVHCMHLVAAVLGGAGVEMTLKSQQQPALVPAGGVAAAPGAVAANSGGAVTLRPLHPAADAVLRHAVRMVAMQSGLEHSVRDSGAAAFEVPRFPPGASELNPRSAGLVGTEEPTSGTAL